MNTTGSRTYLRERSIQELIADLESLIDGELAAERLVACGPQAVPYLEKFLLESAPRSIALPRCRAVRVLGELGADSVLLAYFERYRRPEDAAVLFVEDAVRSAAARALVRCKSETVFGALLQAAKQRATGGLVQALNEFHRPESVPFLFELLEDDLCREGAKEGLLCIPDAARPYAILLLRGCTETPIDGPSASLRRRATVQLLGEIGVASSVWPEVRKFLWDRDPDCVIAAARLGLQVGPDSDKETIAVALLETLAKLNWAQEMEADELLDTFAVTARTVAMTIVKRCKAAGEKPNWMSPFWRVLHHVLGADIDDLYSGAA
jgi:HEAT repeat protein